MTTNGHTDDLGPSPRLVFRACAADLRIEGGDVESITLQYPQQGQAAVVQKGEDGLEISSAVPLTVRAPAGTAVVVDSCTGDVRADKLDDLHVSTHRGDLSLQQVKLIEIASVNGGVRVDGAESVQVTTLNGDLTIRDVRARVAVLGVRGDVLTVGTQGQVSLKGITGDVAIREPGDSLEARDVNGDVELAGSLQNGQWSLEANGDVAIYLDPASNGHVELDSPLGRISSKLDLAAAEESVHRLVGDLGTGAAQLKVVAHNGNITLGKKRPVVPQDEPDAAAARAAARAKREAERAKRRAERLEDKARRRA